MQLPPPSPETVPLWCLFVAHSGATLVAQNEPNNNSVALKYVEHFMQKQRLRKDDELQLPLRSEKVV